MYKKLVIVTRKTRLQELVERFNTRSQAKFYIEHFDQAGRGIVRSGEMGWILEVNTAMNRGMEAMGGRIVKTYRLYEKTLRDGQ